MAKFFIGQGTDIRTVKEDLDWIPKNMTDGFATKDLKFDRSEMIVDPDGRQPGCCGPKTETRGSLYANAKWYGFSRSNWVILVRRCFVEYKP